ncbi:MAG TPA: shikimate kinase [Candidatus Saccharimonadales bacterium]|nr:shikimate kinase [Candidatus Saccharimonadales bacterium]
MKNNITSVYITGFRGTGKSTLGPLIAKKLQWDYVDMDETISKRANKSISEITKNGTNWQDFRELEHELLKELLTKENIVVTTGGGTEVNDNQKNETGKTFGEINADLLKQKDTALLILLYADEDVLADRIKKHELAIFNKPAMRPILNEKYAQSVQTILAQYKNDPEKQKSVLIEHIVNDGLQIYKKRKPLYMALTNHHINTGVLSLEKSVDSILNLIGGAIDE